MKHRMKGFTAIELMVVISIIAILSAIAMPSFNRLMAKLQLEKDIEGLRASIMLARSEAMKLGGGVQIRKLTGATVGMPNATCSTARDWSCGWQVVSTKTNPATVIRQYPSKGKNDVMLTGPGGASTITLNRWGVTNAGFSLSVQHKTVSGDDFSKTLCVSSGGGINVKSSCS